MSENGVRARQLTWGDILMLLQAVVVVGGGFYFMGSLGTKMTFLASAVTELSTKLEDVNAFRLDIMKELGKVQGVVDANVKRIEKLENKLDAR